jgi:hypothetical protein
MEVNATGTGYEIRRKKEDSLGVIEGTEGQVLSKRVWRCNPVS